MRIILGSVLAILVIVVVAAIAIPFAVSTEWIRDQVAATVSAKTGRTLKILGDTSLSVFPDLTLTVGHVAFSNSSGQVGDLVRMEELDVGLKLLPLLSGGVEVDRLILTRPKFSLEVDEEGNPNWIIDVDSTGETITASPSSESGSAYSSRGGRSFPVIETVQLGDVRIVDGEVSYRDVGADVHHRVIDLNATLELPDLTRPSKLFGTLVWQGEEVTFATEIAEPQAISTGTPTAVAFNFEAPQGSMSLAGNLVIKDGFSLEGTLNSSASSLKELVRWLGFDPPQVTGLGSFSITSGIAADETGIALDSASISIDDVTAEGGLLIGLGGSKPMIRATLATSRINFVNYVDAARSNPPSRNSNVPSGSKAASADPKWSDAPIDVSGLASLDADLRISAAGMRIGDVEVGPSALAVKLKDSLLNVDLSELQLYGGRAAGKFTLNGASETPAIAAAFNIDDVALQPFLAAFAEIGWLEGQGRITGSVASRGNTQSALVSALNGEASMVFTNGAIRGINVAQMFRNLQLGNVMSWGEGDTQKTDFSEFASSFTINRGVAQTSDIRLLGPLVRLSGSGIADLPNRTVDFRVFPKLVASLQGQGGGGDLAGLELPVSIRGSWSEPKITPDVDSVLQDPSKAIRAVQEIGRSVGDAIDGAGGRIEDVVRNPGAFLNQLSGSGNPSEAKPNGKRPEPIGEDLFNRLLGQ